MYQWYSGTVGHSTKLYHNIFFQKAFIAAMGEYHQWLPINCARPFQCSIEVESCADRVLKNRLKYDLKSNKIICQKYDL
jgi:hypothetical protein